MALRIVPLSAVRISAVSIGMTHVAGKIVRNVMPISSRAAPQADQRQHELADQDRAADHRADQKTTSSITAPQIRDLEKNICQ